MVPLYIFYFCFEEGGFFLFWEWPFLESKIFGEILVWEFLRKREVKEIEVFSEIHNQSVRFFWQQSLRLERYS